MIGCACFSLLCLLVECKVCCLNQVLCSQQASKFGRSTSAFHRRSSSHLGGVSEESVSNSSSDCFLPALSNSPQ